MATTRISGNQIADQTNATIKNLAFVTSDLNVSPQIISSFILPVGTTAQRPTGVVGSLRYNSTTLSAEIYKPPGPGVADEWLPLAGGGPSIGEDSVIRTNANTISENLTVGPTAGDQFANGMSAGPITIGTGYTVTVESGGSWSIR